MLKKKEITSPLNYFSQRSIFVKVHGIIANSKVEKHV